MQRHALLDRLQAGESFDIVIIGGGATGLGAAVEAAVRGWRVALIERGDFAQGTSSRSTKLVHGGVRYLKQGNVSLVREALRERGHLLRNAPHLTNNLSFVIPNYSWFNKAFYGAGLKVYDAMSGRLSLGPSRLLSRKETIARLPTVEPARLVGGVLYHDGQFDDARLAVCLARTAVDHGATLVNYCGAEALLKKDGRVVGVQVRDRESGREFPVRAKVVVNATGIFADEVRRMDEAAGRPVVAVSQGIHLVLPRKFLPGADALMIPKTADGRVLFAVPWQGCVIVGTTDTPMPRPDEEPRALDEECDFVLSHARKYLSEDPAEKDVLSVFAGQRPLVNAAHHGSTAKLSRDHTILVSHSGLITIAGGKWTTYRKMGEDLVDQAEQLAGLAHRPSTTTDLRLHGWREAGEEAGSLGRYGADAEAIRALERTQPELAKPLHASLPHSRAEVIWQARHEMARTVEDVLARRTRALVLDAQASIEAADTVAGLLAQELGKDDAWRAQQTAAYTRLAAGHLFARRS